MLGAQLKAAAESSVTRQIAIDLVRLIPNLEFDGVVYPVMTDATISAMFMRMLAVWSARHPAVGYVQGLDRLVVPFFRTHFFGAASLSEASTSSPAEGDSGDDDEGVMRTPPSGVSRARSVTSPRSRGQGGAMSRMSWEAREAACYWCLEKLLEGIQDRFIHNQPALQALIFRFNTMLEAADEELAEKLSSTGVSPWRCVSLSLSLSLSCFCPRRTK
jgi:hypothetical protein